MAEFKLGRIRFVWKGDWYTGTSYYKDDVVRYGGRTYICTVGHTAAGSFDTDLDYSPTKWNLLTDGSEWKGDWSTATPYKIRDIVKYGANLYISTDGHTSASQFETDLGASKWELFAEGIDWQGAWVTSTGYTIGDVVRYGGNTYIAVTTHTSGTFATDLGAARWQLWNPGIEYRGSWATATAYKVNDVVKSGGGLWITSQDHTSDATSFENDQATYWSQFVKGFEFEGEWSGATSYQPGDIVKYGGNQYIAKTTHTNSTPTPGTDWDLFTEGFNFVSDWSGATAYKVGDVVRLNGYTYLATATSTNQEPPNASYWERLTAGIYWTGEWANSTAYKVGDAVEYEGNSYIVVQAHTSADDDSGTTGDVGRSPATDSTGTYYNILALGSETTVLTTTGDLVYYGGAGPTRLPVGITGQILTAGTQYPQWQSLGQTDHTYFVSPDGVDLPYPNRGGSFDNPWKTIRYACEQIEKGARNPDAQKLLELNRPFIQREVTEWIDYQINYYTNTAPDVTSIWYNFTYNDNKCERDTGYIVDALIYDIGHGGNVKTRGAANSYVGSLYESEVETYLTLSTEKDQDIAAFTYMLEVVQAVLNQTAPAANYQTLNGDNSTATVAQTFDANLTAESGTYTTCVSLVEIIQNALEDEDNSRIPERLAPNNLVRVSTGRFREVLPIIVPECTAILGDELRSTNAGPAAASDRGLHISDAKYSEGALQRMEAIVGDIVLGNTVSKTSGNSETQNDAFPYADNGQKVALEQKIRAIYANIDWRTGATGLRLLTEATGYNSSFLNGYGDARKNIAYNKKFFAEQVKSYINTNYPNLKYSRTKCLQDVGYIVDAMVYDLTYGGYSESLNAGLAYFDGPAGALAFDSTEKTATLASYAYLKSIMQTAAGGSAVVSNQSAITQFTGTAGSAASITAIGANMDIIYNIINGGTTSAPQVRITTIATNVATTSSNHGLGVGDAIEMIDGGNGLTAGVKYWILTVPASNQFTVSASYGGSTATLSNGTSLTLDAYAIDYPSAADASIGGSLTAAFVALDGQQENLVTATTNYITANYPSLTYNTSKCERDVRLILEAMGFDAMFNSNWRTIKAAHSYLRSTASDVYDGGQKTATLASYKNLAAVIAGDTATYVNGDSTTASRIANLFNLLDAIIYSGSVEGSRCASEYRNDDHAVLQLERNRDFIVAEINAYIAATYKDNVTATSGSGNVITISDTGWLQKDTAVTFSDTAGNLETGVTYYVQNIVSSTTFTVALTRNSNTALTLTSSTPTMTVNLKFDAALCTRDTNSYIDAIKYDLKFAGNYKSMLSSRYYANAVVGSLEENMFLLRDNTGVRDMTLQGLTGDLLPANSYGTSRVSAGAYASLDPGWGPEDYRTWIMTRSPYVQGVTCIGTGAIGQKIDGALHNGGNDSIVSNDFTQVISDGIGAWVENNGRAELVSVFTYYSHIGYLATNGGRIRGTNGNNSYGDFGSVAEGYDATEIPNTAVVDNIYQYEAGVGNVLTDNSKMLELQYDNAGIDYTEATWTLTGGGVQASVEQDEFRDGGVFQVRLLDYGDTSSGQLGGSGYTTKTGNVAGGGTTTSITLTPTDDQLTNGYVGMRVTITTGTGAGQYGIISANDAGTKVAQVKRESDDVAGWDHILNGTAIVAPDASSVYQITPNLSFTSPPTTVDSGSMSATAVWTDAVYGDTVGVYTPAYTYAGSGTGAIFTVTRNGTKYNVTVTGGGTGYTRLETITIAGNNLGGTATTNDIVLTITAINSSTGEILEVDQVGFGSGGRFVAVSSGGTATSYSTNGTTWTAGGPLPTSGTWTGVAHGLIDDGSTIAKVSRFVAVRSGSAEAAYSDDGGTTWTTSNLPVSAAWVGVVYGAGRYLAVASDSQTVAISVDGQIWDITGTLGATGYTALAYGKGTFVVTKAGDTGATRYSTNNGIAWTAANLPANSTWVDVGYGRNTFVAVASDSNSGAVSADGQTWIAMTIGSADGSSVGGYQKVGYGQGVFVVTAYNAGAEDYSYVARSENGIYWTIQGLPAPANALSGYNAVAFGNPNREGMFVMVDKDSGTHVAKLMTGTTTRAISSVSDTKIAFIRITEPGSGYLSPPTLTITDPNNVYEAPTQVRIGDGVLGQPSWKNRGVQYTTGSAEIDAGDGYADFFQTGSFVAVRRITQRPVAGSNVVFAHLPDRTFKLVSVLTFRGTNDGAYTAFYQVSPELLSTEAADHLTGVTTRIRYSQVRLTGHDFLDIGTGSVEETNYPNTPTQDPVPANETVESGGGRVFFTSTDQDGNFRVGDLFSVEQSTGVATLNADAFNISGLQEISLGEVTLGGGSATITEFSTDPFFTADSDSIIPTQRAIKAYIASQIGGGGAALNVNSVTAGNISISGNTITTAGTYTGSITMNAKFNFTGGITGYPLAFNYFLV